MVSLGGRALKDFSGLTQMSIGRSSILKADCEVTCRLQAGEFVRNLLLAMAGLSGATKSPGMAPDA